VVDSPRKAVEPSDIVVTAGPITRPPHATIKADWLACGSFASSVDYASYWSLDALEQFDRTVTDDLPQFKAFQRVGYCEGVTVPDCELASLIAGTSEHRRSPSERAFCCNLGIAATDIAVAGLVVQHAAERGIGSRLPR
jgi:ornithine cyclodeaminase/alanine dehydrogenase-like protein (mu-crystallin family)